MAGYINITVVEQIRCQRQQRPRSRPSIQDFDRQLHHHNPVVELTVRVEAVYLAIGINLAGEKDVLGLWNAQTEGAKFWLQVVTELKSRGVQGILIACVDGLKGFPDAIEAVYPHAAVQLCIVHMVRNSLNYVSWKLRSEVAADLKRIYTCSTVDEAEQKLAEFEDK